MRIVIDATAAVSGGRVYMKQLLPELTGIAVSHQFRIFHAADEFEPNFADLSERVQFQQVHLPVGEAAGAGVLKMLWRLLVLPWHLWCLQPDVFFSNAGFAPIWKPRRTKVVVALHNSMPLREDLIPAESSLAGRWRLRMLRHLMLRTFRCCDGVIVFSEDSRQCLNKFAGTMRCEPTVIYHGVEWNEADRQRKADPAVLRRRNIESPYLLFVSHLHRYKNVLVLLQAFAQLAKEDAALKLVLVGEASDPAYWREIQTAIAQHGLQSCVLHLPGCARVDLLHLYRGAAAFVQPSLAETFSLPLAEALAMGLPVAAARSSALPEIAGDAALYFAPDNAEEAAEALRRILSDEELRDELSAKAVRQAAKFSWAQAAQRTLSVLEQVRSV